MRDKTKETGGRWDGTYGDGLPKREVAIILERVELGSINIIELNRKKTEIGCAHTSVGACSTREVPVTVHVTAP